MPGWNINISKTEGMMLFGWGIAVIAGAAYLKRRHSVHASKKVARKNFETAEQYRAQHLTFSNLVDPATKDRVFVPRDPENTQSTALDLLRTGIKKEYLQQWDKRSCCQCPE